MSTTKGADLDFKVADIKNRLAVAQRARARAEHERDAAQAAASNARAQLSQEFQVDTQEQAAAMLAALEAELATAVAQMSAALDEAGS